MGEGAGEEEGEVEPSHLEESLMGDLRDQMWSPSEKEERSIADCSARGVSGGLRSGEGGRGLTGHAVGRGSAGDGGRGREGRAEELEVTAASSRTRKHMGTRGEQVPFVRRLCKQW